MEPESVNTLVDEAEKLKKEVLSSFSGKPPEKIEYLFGDMSDFFHEETLAEWRRQERFDELIEYILYQYKEAGGEEFWQLVLLDLRLKKDEIRAHKLLNGLYPARADAFWVALKNYKENPDNHFSASKCAKTKGEVMKVLYEHAFVLENKPNDEQNKELVNLVRSRINEIAHEQKTT